MKRYWAAAPKEEIGKEILKKVLAQKKHLEKTGKLTALRKAYKTFYGTPHIEQIEGSLQAIEVNHFANLIRHIHVMVTSTRPAWEPRAINTDLESQADTQLAAGLLDYYMREKGLEPQLIEAVEKCLFLLEGWIGVDWDVLGGEAYGKDPETGLPIYEGDIKYTVYTMLDITRDLRLKNMKHKWLITRHFDNKWDVAAKYCRGNEKHPLWEKITGLQDDEKANVQYELNADSFDEAEESDQIPIYTLKHEKTPAMPEGRMTIVAADDIVLFDGPLPYEGIFTFPITSAKKYETAFGHSQSHDLLSLNDAFNATVSAILSNQSANAVQNFMVPKGAAPRVTQLMEGMNVWEYDPQAGKMESMDLLKTAPEVFNFADFLVKQQELISGVNQISRGNAPATLSGTAMALIQQQSIQFSSGVALGYALLSESVGTATIKLLERFAVVPRVAAIAGKSKRTQMRSFKGADLSGISRVIVDSANPLTKTAAGRVEIANQLLATPGMIKSAEQYIGVLTTGNLEPLYEHENGQLMLMRGENEWLMEGKQVQVVMTDDDAIHVLEHSSILSSPEARENPAVLQVVLEHIQAHINQGKTKDPVLAAMLKQASFAPPPMMPGQMPPPPGGPGAPPEGGGPGPVMDNSNPITQQAEQTKLPQPAEPPQVA